MAYDYAKTAATAQRLLTKFGAAGTLKSQTPGAYNPATGAAAITTFSQGCTAAVFDVEQKLVDGTNVLAGDKTAYVATVNVAAPVPGHILTWQAKDYRVITVKTLAPAGMAVLYELLMRP
ncbi:MAG: hypothetical protein EOP35_04125 [Rubrivivax sp.]|nr:MAG: hypothetical protein EOP35_04125 [Rubrivivax sp.]